MGTNGFDLGFEASQQRQQQRNQIAEQERLQRQNTVGMRLLDSINQASSIKPQIKDPNSGELIDNPAYSQAQKDRATLMSQYSALNAPEQHASFGQHLHGLIFGNADHRPQQPALSPNSSPNELTPPPDANAAPAAPTGPPAPLHPMAAAPPDHPVHAITNGIKALGDHLKAFANPLPAQEQPDPALMAKYYKDPAEVAFERNKELWGVRGQNALAVAQERTKALLASLSARPPRMLSQTTIPDLLKQIEVDPDQIIYGPNGQELSPAQLAELPPGTIAREFKAGPNVFYALGDQNSKTLNVNGHVYDIPAVGPISLNGPNQNSTVVGQATSTLPKTSSTTDPFGLTTTSQHQTVVPPAGAGNPPANSAPPPPADPVLKTRPVSSAAPQPPSSTPAVPLSAVNANIAAANAASSKLNKGKPVSLAAPSVPTGSLPPLDANGHIPAGIGNDLVRQFANNILDGMDTKDIPNPKARAAAEAMVDKFVPNYSRGAFTPKEKIQFKVATDFLQQLKDSKALSVLDSFVSREKIAHAMKDPAHMNLADRVIAYNLTPPEAEFVRMFNAARGTVAGLSQITRSGRATNNQVQTIALELPNVFQSSSSKDAKDRVDQLLKEANIALTTNPRDVGKGGPVSANAPQLGQWKPPADAPAAPQADNKVLKDSNGTVIAKSQGGKWVQP